MSDSIFVRLDYEQPSRTVWVPSNALDAFIDSLNLEDFPIHFSRVDNHVHIIPSQVGGKGGFGSMLRAQGGRMASQKTTNYSACRDLSGRRLKTLSDATKLSSYLTSEPSRQAEDNRKHESKFNREVRLAERVLKDGEIQEMPEETREKMNRFGKRNPEFFTEKKVIVSGVRNAVLRGLKRKKNVENEVAADEGKEGSSASTSGTTGTALGDTTKSESSINESKVDVVSKTTESLEDPSSASLETNHQNEDEPKEEERSQETDRANGTPVAESSSSPSEKVIKTEIADEAEAGSPVHVATEVNGKPETESGGPITDTIKTEAEADVAANPKGKGKARLASEALEPSEPTVTEGNVGADTPSPKTQKKKPAKKRRVTRAQK